MTHQDRDDDTFVLSENARLFLFYRERGLSTKDARVCADTMEKMGYRIPDDWRPA